MWTIPSCLDSKHSLLLAPSRCCRDRLSASQAVHSPCPSPFTQLASPHQSSFHPFSAPPREMHSVPFVPGCGPCYHADITPPRKRSWTSDGEGVFLCVSSAWFGMSFLCGRICDVLFKVIEMTIVKAFVKWNAVAALTNPFLSLAVLSRAGFSSLALFWHMPLVCELRS